jgi:hydroxymethylpyrimidine/phosphomethylpyrimidine kinase
VPEDSVLVFSGLDPSGGAGISADIETINQFGVTALPIVTTLTVQNTESVIDLQEVESDFITDQFNHLIEDISFSVVKVGLLSSERQIDTIHTLLSKCKDATVVLDPIVRSSAGRELLNEKAVESLKLKLLPLVSVLTPNLGELKALCPNMDELDAVRSLPCEWLLLTTSDASEIEIEHRLYRNAKLIDRFNYKKLPGSYHGSGCTLASAVSALLSLGVNADIACKSALKYTYQTLLNAKSIGKMQYHPNRQKP